MLLSGILLSIHESPTPAALNRLSRSSLSLRSFLSFSSWRAVAVRLAASLTWYASMMLPRAV
ncbi:hypothetical protein ACTBV5_004082, partial [Yersinia enterocolitica]